MATKNITSILLGKIVYVPILVTDMAVGLHYHSLVARRIGLVPGQESLTLEPGELVIDVTEHNRT